MLVKLKSNMTEIEVYPYSFNMLEINNPGINFSRLMSDESLAGWLCAHVEIPALPQYDEENENIESDVIPKIVNGKWTIIHRTVSKSSDEKISFINTKKSQLFARIEAKANTVRSSGVEIAGSRIKTDISSLEILSRATKAVKLSNGEFLSTNVAELSVIKSDIFTFLVDCDNREIVLSNAVVAAIFVADLDIININSGWPS